MAPTYQRILNEAKSLSPDERQRLVAALSSSLTAAGSESRPRWLDHVGSAPYPLCGEDAQSHVTRTRHEADAARGVA
jgi:hypothetical protein